MVDKDKIDLQENQDLKVPEKRVPTKEQLENFDWNKDKKKTEKEVFPEDKIVSAELRQEIEKMELDEGMKAEAEKKAEKVEFLGEKAKIEYLLKMAHEKGVIFAVQVAMKMNDPYLLDILHDTLAQEGFYKKNNLK